MLPEVPPCHLGVGGVPPLRLAESNQRIAQVGDIEGPARVVVGEMADSPSLGSRLDDRKSQIREPPDVLPAPLRGLGCRSSQHHQSHQA